MKHAKEIIAELGRLVPGHKVVVTRHEGENNAGRNWVAAAGAALSDDERASFAKRVGELRASDPKIRFED